MSLEIPQNCKKEKKAAPHSCKSARYEGRQSIASDGVFEYNSRRKFTRKRCRTWSANICPGNVRERIQELLKERGITQAQLAARIGSTESAVSRFISGKTDMIIAEHIIRIAKAFNVSTDFLLGVVNIPDRKNYDVEGTGAVRAGGAESVHEPGQRGDCKPAAGKPTLCRGHVHD